MSLPKVIYDSDEYGSFYYYEGFDFVIRRFRNNEDEQPWIARSSKTIKILLTKTTQEYVRFIVEVEDDFNSQDEITEEFLSLVALKYSGAK